MGYKRRNKQIYPAQYDNEHSKIIAQSKQEGSPVKALIIGLVIAVLVFGLFYFVF